MSPARQRRLEDLARVLLDEKDFEGCGGLAMTDPIRVTIAGQAALLLLGRDMDYLPELRAVLVYPTGYWARSVSQPIPGVVSERDEGRLGESSPGTVVLSWDDSRTGARRAEGENVVLHEFAHQVDRHFGLTESLTERPVSDLSPWQRSFRREFERFTGAERPREGRLLDEYAATNPAEFLAVGTEVFIERPGPLRDACPRLYGLFRALYRIDPGREFDIP